MSVERGNPSTDSHLFSSESMLYGADIFGSRYFEKVDDLYRQTLQIILEHFSSVTWETTEGCEWLFLFISFYF